MKTHRILALSLGILPLLTLGSCKDPAEKLGEGFRLPEGDVKLGETAFIELKCNRCHTVAGVTLPKTEEPPPFDIELGGEVRKVKSYGELVTAITQPQHILSSKYLVQFEKAKRDGITSPMPSQNDEMTVTQLTSIVTFLHSHYLKAPAPGSNYPPHAP